MADISPRYAFEDFEPGHALQLGSYAVTADEIIDFAREFDPQPFHLDEAAGKSKPARRPRRLGLAHLCHVHAT